MSRPIVMKPMNFSLQVPFLSLNKMEQHPGLTPYAYQALVSQTQYLEAMGGAFRNHNQSQNQNSSSPPAMQLETLSHSSDGSSSASAGSTSTTASSSSMNGNLTNITLTGTVNGTANKRKLEAANGNSGLDQTLSFPARLTSGSRLEPETKRAKGLLRVKQAGWTAAEDEILRRGIVEYSYKLGEPDYERIIAKLPNRTIKQAKERWKNCLDPGIVKGEWSVAELCRLLEMVQKYDQQWTTIQRCMKSRSMHCIKSKGRKILGESLSKKLRRITKSPSLKKPWTSEEVSMLKSLHEEFGYDIDVVSTKMAVAGFCRPEAQVERKILQVCECKQCKAECERYMKVDINFKRAWTISKAASLKAKLLKEGKLS